MEIAIEGSARSVLPEITGADFNAAIELVERRICESVSGAEGIVREMCAHIAGSGGKRIRPRLVLGSGMAFSALNDRVIDTAVAAEYIHMASLVHDDVIDQSPLRRGKPSINKKWGNHAAVLCGDWLFARAFGILSGAGMNGSLRCMVEAIQSMCRGELLQAAHRFDPDIGEGAYYDGIAGKTGKLLENCCRAGAAAGGAGASGVDALGKYGLNLGMAFQIIDDILDFEGSAESMGKPGGEDLRQGVVTLPVILLLRDKRFGGDARAALSGNRLRWNSAADDVQALVKASGAIDAAYAMAWSLIDKALDSLAGLPDSGGKAALRKLAENLRNRTA